MIFINTVFSAHKEFYLNNNIQYKTPRLSHPKCINSSNIRYQCEYICVQVTDKQLKYMDIMETSLDIKGIKKV